MTFRTFSLFAALALFLLTACDPKGNTTDTGETTDLAPTEQTPEPGPDPEQDDQPKTAPAVQPQHYICYKNDNNADMLISISFDKEERALQVKYKGQDTAMNLEFVREDFQEGGAHPNIETYYMEMLDGKKNGTYKLTHSGAWDYAEYIRGKDGKKFSFTIDHELTDSGNGYRTTPCF